MTPPLPSARPRAALVRPRCACEDPEFQEPLGAEAICGYLREHGVAAQVFDRMLGVKAGEIEEYNPDWVGFSLMTDADVPDALRLLQMLSRPGRRFFAGGLFVTTCFSQARALFPRDTALIAGEGEGPALELVTTGEMKDGPRPGPDEWAFASRDRLGEYLDRGGVINIRASRGCRGRCAFCTTPRLCAPAGRHETRGVSKIAEEMQGLIRAGYPPVFNFTDDMFGDHARVEELEKELESRGLRAAFSLEMRAQEAADVPADDWPRLHAGGLCRVFTGLESLNPDTLAAWHKPVPVRRLLNALNAMRAAGIACEAGYILWHENATPDSAWAEAKELRRLGLLSPKTALSRLILYPGSLLHEKAHGDGVFPCPLTPESQRLLSRWETLLQSLQPLWIAAACAHPRLACQAFLCEDKRAALARLEACLEKIKDLTYGCLASDALPSPQDCQEIRGELRALHIAGPGCR